MNEKEHLENFKAACRMYPQEKKDLEENRNSTPNPDPGLTQLFVYMQEDIDYVENTFRDIRQKCGTNAELMTWLLYVERKTQTALMEEWKVSRKQQQYAQNRWLQLLLNERKKTEKDDLFAFRCSCRTYLIGKQKLEENKGITDMNRIRKRTLQLIHEDIAYTEKILDSIQKQYGEEAWKLTVEVLINGRTQEETAEKAGITKRKLQYSMEKWLKAVLTILKNNQCEYFSGGQ